MHFQGFDLAWGAEWGRFLLGWECEDDTLKLWVGPFFFWILW